MKETYEVGDRVVAADRSGVVLEVSTPLRGTRAPHILVMLEGNTRAMWWYPHELTPDRDAPHDAPEGIPDEK